MRRLISQHPITDVNCIGPKTQNLHNDTSEARWNVTLEIGSGCYKWHELIRFFCFGQGKNAVCSINIYLKHV